MTPVFLSRSSGRFIALVITTILCVAIAPAAFAYVGPGAGFALLSSFLVLFTTIVLAFLSLLIWPFRALYRMLKRQKTEKPWAKRLIVVGFDGQDPRLTDQWMAEGKMPNFQKLADMGCYRRLGTTYPSISPVAWSSFSTGTNPAKHNIYDFLDRDWRTYLPKLSSTRIGEVKKFLKIGKWRLPLEKPELTLLRKSKPFWTILGENQIWSTVLRVPITFPPDKFYGAQLAAMCVPDLLGTQGTFLLYTTRPSEGAFKEGGERIEISLQGDRIETTIDGPENAFLDGDPPPPLSLPLTVELDRQAGTARVTVGKEKPFDMRPGELTQWVPLEFKAAPGIKVNGLCRMVLTEMDEHVSLYVTPLNIDPEKPAMPISHPSYYSTYLSKRVGPFATLGLAEDTWALNEKITDDATFLKQTYDIDDERKEMFFSAMDRLRKGSLVCVFDGTDRIQHMFWRYMEEGHPAARGLDPSPEHKHAIEKLYEHNDRLLGEVMGKLREGDVLMVLSDHGFTSFRRGINLNTWLHANGYLHLKEGAEGSEEWLREVDWSRTKAYAVGLTGMFLNLEGREGQGIVKPGEEAEAIKKELIEKLSGIVDDETGEVAINEIFDANDVYNGPYIQNAPDLLVGYNHGYRISWDGATGVTSGPIFEDNTKAWSGDHGVDPRIVPGVFFCNHDIDADNPSLLDIAPSALRLFGLEPARHMEGQALWKNDPLSKKAASGSKDEEKAA